ncbi:MAG: Excinuclease ATPase subunit [Massilia sp.]|nr:Excinuclease ATPase subunit [Massilia sp.]
MPLAAAMGSADAKAKLSDSVKFYFGDQKSPKTLAELGSSKTSQKTNAFNKSDTEACHWVFLSSMIQLQKQRCKLGTPTAQEVHLPHPELSVVLCSAQRLAVEPELTLTRLK